MGAGRSTLTMVRKFYPEVEKVRDADADLLIEVSRTDEKASRKKDHAECALATACKRKMKCQGVIISVGRAYVIKHNQATRYILEENTSREIVSFDRGAGFQPGEYLLKKPGKNQRLGVDRRAGRDGGPHSGNKSRLIQHFTEGIRSALYQKEV